MANKPWFIAALASLPQLASAAPSPGAGMASVFLSLLLILGGFILVALLIRRYLPGGGRQGVVKLVGSTMIGARERVVVVEIDDTWLLLGVGGGQVTLLDKRAKPTPPADALPRE
jgi:flagellar protein FliO/FliZ